MEKKRTRIRISAHFSDKYATEKMGKNRVELETSKASVDLRIC